MACGMVGIMPLDSEGEAACRDCLFPAFLSDNRQKIHRFVRLPSKEQKRNGQQIDSKFKRRLLLADQFFDPLAVFDCPYGQLRSIAQAELA